MSFIAPRAPGQTTVSPARGARNSVPSKFSHARGENGQFAIMRGIVPGNCPWKKHQPCLALALASPCALRPHADGSWTLILTRHDLASASASLISASMILAASFPSSSLHLRTPTPTLPPPSQPPPSPSFFSPTIATAFRRHCPSPPSPPPIATVATANRHRRRLVAASLCAASPAPRLLYPHILRIATIQLPPLPCTLSTFTSLAFCSPPPFSPPPSPPPST